MSFPNSCVGFLTLVSPQIHVLNPTPVSFWWQGIYRSNQVRSLVWTPIKYNWCPYEKGNLDIGMCIEWRWYEDTGRRETWNTFLSLQKEPALPAPWFQISKPELWEYPQFVIHNLLWQPSQTNTASMNLCYLLYHYYPMAFDHSHSGISMSFLEFDAKIKHFILNIKFKVWQV